MEVSGLSGFQTAEVPKLKEEKFSRRIQRLDVGLGRKKVIIRGLGNQNSIYSR